MTPYILCSIVQAFRDSFVVLTRIDFTDMVMSSIEFAGASNYCPVLVGAWAGAIYGIEGIPDWMINHHMVVGGNKVGAALTQDSLIAVGQHQRRASSCRRQALCCCREIGEYLATIRLQCVFMVDFRENYTELGRIFL